MTERRDDIRWLQGWYIDQCNGDWEHQHGVKIETLDNPGWRVRIDLAWTPLEQRPMTPIEIHRSEHDWVIAAIKDHHFEGACGPDNLTELIRIFHLWATEKNRGFKEALVNADRSEQRRLTQEIVNRMLLGSNVDGIELSSKYALYFYKEKVNTEYVLTTLWNFQVLPTVIWPDGLTDLQKQALEIQRVLFKRVIGAECQSDGGLTIILHGDMRLQINAATETPSIDQLWTLSERGTSVADGATKIVVDAEGEFTLWRSEIK